MLIAFQEPEERNIEALKTVIEENTTDYYPAPVEITNVTDTLEAMSNWLDTDRVVHFSVTGDIQGIILMISKLSAPGLGKLIAQPGKLFANIVPAVAEGREKSSHSLSDELNKKTP